MKIAKSGGIEQILAAMKEHKSSVVVQSYGCAALGCLAINGRLRGVN